MDLGQLMEQMKKNKIGVQIEGEASEIIGASRFGGCPDVPSNFKWPYFKGKDFDDIEANRPLSFLAQFNCEQITQFDEEGVLPQKGVLSFFYEEATAKWGFDPKDKGCARVFWFEDVDCLKPCSLPEDLEEDYRNPAIGIGLTKEISYPSCQDFPPECEKLTDEEYDLYDEKYDNSEFGHQLLGWPKIIQNNIALDCELIQRGYYLGGTWKGISDEEKENAIQIAPKKWRLLFQLDEIEEDDFYLSFGDGGMLYFYITQEDLEKRNFDNVWLVYQCL